MKIDYISAASVVSAQCRDAARGLTALMALHLSCRSVREAHHEPHLLMADQHHAYRAAQSIALAIAGAMDELSFYLCEAKRDIEVPR